MCRCFLIGHRETPQSVFGALQDAIKDMVIQNGVDEFIVGHYGNFDMLAQKAVIAVKKVYPHIRLTLLLPYHPAQRKMTIPSGVDGTYYPFFEEKVPPRLAIVKANQHMVDRCPYLITYVTHPASNARNIQDYALQKGCIVNNVANEEAADR